MKNKYQLIIRFFLAYSVLFFCVEINGQTTSDIIESVLPGVLTVAVVDMAEEDVAFGFGGDDKKAKVAYEAALDLTGIASTGSGFLIKYKGKPYVVTNAHVVDGAEAMSGAIAGFSIARKKYPLRLVGGDSFYDLAVLAFDEEPPGEELTYLEFAKKDPRLAEKVFAIGNPLGLYPYSVTDGIVSGKNRLFQNPTTGKYGFLQHTATLIWGNSGGPLVNAKGEVVGVNAWIGTRSKEGQQQIFSQLNFAIELSVAQRVVTDLIENKGRVQRAYLGVEFASRLDYTGELSAPFIHTIIKGSPAENVLKDKVGFLVKSINENAVSTLQDIVRILEETKYNNEISIVLEKPRDDGFPGKKQTLTIQSKELTIERLEQISQHFFLQYTDYEWPETSERNINSKANQSKPRVEVMSAGSSQKTYIAKPGEMKYNLVGAGLLDDWGRGSLYRIANARDMGTIIRLCSLEGHLSAAVQVGEGKAEHIRFFMQDADFNEIRVLYY